MVAVLEALARPTAVLETHELPLGPNTTIKDDAMSPETWVPWAEFTYTKLTSIFAHQLRARYRGPSQDDADALPLDLRICNEQTLQAAFVRFLMPTVNSCLYGLPGNCHYGAGSRCTDEAIPDWSCVAHDQYVNYVPGDTKLSTKFFPDLINSSLDGHRKEWGKVLRQVTYYMAKFSSRYGFIITDAHLVVLRITRLRTDAGLGPGRAHRSDSLYAINYLASADSSFANTTASYMDDNPLNWEIEPPEYAVISWSDHGPGKLTVKLALWSLAMMAVNGGCGIDYSYPALDSWRQEGSKYVHNTSGATKTRLGRHDRMEGPDPVGATLKTVASGPGAWEGYTDEGVAEASGSGDVEDEVAYFSHARTPVGVVEEMVSGTVTQGFGDNDGEEEQVEEEEGEEDDGEEEESYEVEGDVDDEDETKTVTPTRRKVTVTIKKRWLSGSLYYTDARGRDIDTSRSEWTKVHKGYELRGRRHTYFTKSFPK